ncbi:DUF2694 family protein [Mycobacterium marinum]|uniref:DUF2694 family protein n=1 Tax=Mycobacterium marinum TaxID=1781 RepID=UPI000358ABFE|nr:DUF2694 family protein [Mycobacterium marinum]EPQ79122.1 RD1 region associated protein [Mycobacterium marinum MB2]MDC8975751.1 DUF2694 family protein [Mycobacterium marinum]MDC9006967.1 DUF2694 family protein [Mycobacterium marinum]RFZ57885.1 ESX-1 secretion-associated protein EspD [Mycobacterium marinum]GJO17420.1 ESX-1 secretion-associated protein EspH [Mycobacterium marinum]
MTDQPGYDAHNYLAGLGFSGPAAGETDSAIDALLSYAPAQPEDTGSDMSAILGATEEDKTDECELFTVTNPQGSVSVSAVMGGDIHRVELSDKVDNMSEPRLAEEIFVLADLARQKARAAQHAFMLQGMDEVNDEEQRAVLREIVEKTMNLPTPEQAAAAEEEVFATRYKNDFTATTG